MNFNKLILPELNNKLLISEHSLPKEKLILSNNFSLKSLKQFKLIKNVIGMELLANKRPKIVASLYNKQLIVRLNTTINLNEIIYLQKTPVPWNKYISSFNLFKNKFVATSLLNQITVNCRSKKNNYLSVIIKSAYLD